MKRILILILILSVFIFSSCGSQYSDENSRDDAAQSTTEFSTNDGVQTESADNSGDLDVDQEIDTSTKEQQVRKVIYTANLHIEVKNYQNTVNEIQSETNKLQGYVVESSMYSEQEGQLKNGQMTVRIPQEHFQKFIELVEDGSSRVLESSTSGQDVTEAYIDLESRLESKQIVEERLISFMEKAEKTEDLLKISNDLATVQEEIEDITGKMKYLDNKTDLATINIHIFESDVNLTSPGKDQLNTWEKTKEQLLKSTNFIITFFSSLFIFVIGNIPVLTLIGLITLITLFSVKKVKKRKKEIKSDN